MATSVLASLEARGIVGPVGSRGVRQVLKSYLNPQSVMQRALDEIPDLNLSHDSVTLRRKTAPGEEPIRPGGRIGSKFPKTKKAKTIEGTEPEVDRVEVEVVRAGDIAHKDIRPASNRVEVEKAWAEGHAIFAAHEMDEELHQVTTKEMLDAYAPEGLFIGPRIKDSTQAGSKQVLDIRSDQTQGLGVGEVPLWSPKLLGLVQEVLNGDPQLQARVQVALKKAGIRRPNMEAAATQAVFNQVLDIKPDQTFTVGEDPRPMAEVEADFAANKTAFKAAIETGTTAAQRQASWGGQRREGPQRTYQLKPIREGHERNPSAFGAALNKAEREAEARRVRRVEERGKSVIWDRDPKKPKQPKADPNDAGPTEDAFSGLPRDPTASPIPSEGLSTVGDHIGASKQLLHAAEGDLKKLDVDIADVSEAELSENLAVLTLRIQELLGNILGKNDAAIKTQSTQSIRHDMETALETGEFANSVELAEAVVNAQLKRFADVTRKGTHDMQVVARMTTKKDLSKMLSVYDAFVNLPTSVVEQTIKYIRYFLPKPGQNDPGIDFDDVIYAAAMEFWNDVNYKGNKLPVINKLQEKYDAHLSRGGTPENFDFGPYERGLFDHLRAQGNRGAQNISETARRQHQARQSLDTKNDDSGAADLLMAETEAALATAKASRAESDDAVSGMARTSASNLVTQSVDGTISPVGYKTWFAFWSDAQRNVAHGNLQGQMIPKLTALLHVFLEGGISSRVSPARTANMKKRGVDGTFHEFYLNKEGGWDIARIMAEFPEFGAGTPRTVRANISLTFGPLLAWHLTKDMPGAADKFSSMRAGETPKGKIKADAITEAENSPSPLSLIAGTEIFFRSYFMRRGMNSNWVDSLTATAMRMAALNADVSTTGVGELVHNAAAGLSRAGKDGQNLFIHLTPNEIFPVEELNTFYIMQTMGHELHHQGRALLADKDSGLSQARRRAMTNTMTWANDIGPTARSDILNEVFAMFVPKKYFGLKEFDDVVQHRTKIAAENSEEFLSDLAGMTALGAAAEGSSAKLIKESLFFGDPHLQEFTRGVYVDLVRVATPLADHFNQTYGGQLENGADFSTIMQQTRSLLATLKEVDSITAQWRELESNLDPTARNKALAQGKAPTYRHSSALQKRAKEMGENTAQASFLKGAVDDAKTAMGVNERAKVLEYFGMQPNFFDEFLAPSAQLTEKYPILLPVMDIAQAFRSLANDAALKMLTPFVRVTKGGKSVIDAEMKGLKRAFTPEVNKIVNDIALRKNAEQRILSDAEMKEMGKHLPESDQQALVDVNRAFEEIAGSSALLIHKFSRNRVNMHVANLLRVRNKGLSSKEVLALGNQLSGIALLQLSEHPQLKLKGQALMQDFAANHQTLAGVTPAFRQAQALHGNVTRLVDTLGIKADPDKPGEVVHTRSWFMSEQRYGQFHVGWGKDGKNIGFTAFDDKVSAARYAEGKKEEGFEVYARDKYVANDPMSGLAPEVASAFAKLDQAAFDEAKKEFGEGAELEGFLEHFKFSPGEKVMEQVAKRGLNKFLAKRKGREGTDRINFAEGQIKYVSGLANALARADSKQRGQLLLSDPGLRAHPAIAKLGSDHLNTVLNPPGKEWKTLKSMNFLWYMGLNVSSMAVELFQPLLTVVPFYTRQGIGVGDGYRALGDAAKVNVKRIAKGTTGDKDLDIAIGKARDAQKLDHGVMQEFFNQDDVALTSLRTLAVAEHPLEKGVEMLKKPPMMLAHFARAMYSNSTRWNSHLTFISAWKLGKEKKGMNNAEAYDFAARAIEVTNFQGGQAARPGFFNKTGGQLSHGMAGAMYSLQSFTFSTIAMMGRTFREAIDSTLPVADRKQARLAAAQMLATQAILSGALGMPLVGGLLKVIEEIFEDSEIEASLRGSVKDLLKHVSTDDQDPGQWLTDAVFRGPLNQMSGFDFASRLGLGEFLGVSPYDGFSLKNLIGPTGGLFDKMFQGVQSAAAGDFSQAAEDLVPNAIRRPLQLLNDDGDFRDRQGRLIKEASGMEQVGHSIGLTPQSVRDIHDQKRLTRHSEEVHSRQVGRFHNRVADLLEEGDVEQVRDLLLDRQEEDPSYNSVAGGRRVAEILQARHIPVDVTRDGARGNAQDRSRIGGTFPIRPGITEVDRLKQKKAIERSIRLPGLGRINKHEMSVAAQVDKLMRMNPRLTVQEARLILDGRMQVPER